MEPRRSTTSRENVCEAGGGRSFARVPRGWAVRPRRAAGAVPGESRGPWWARRRPGGASARRAGDAGCAPGRWRLRSSRQDASPPLRCGGWSPARPCSSSSRERPAHPGGRHSQTRNGQRVAPVKEPSGRPRPRCRVAGLGRSHRRAHAFPGCHHPTSRVSARVRVSEFNLLRVDPPSAAASK